MRDAAQALGREVATNLEVFWERGRNAKEGPIDVIDMFSGCGGMSAGFRALNGAFPVFRLAMAIDIDEVANRTYEGNLALRPQAKDVSKLAADPRVLRRLVQSSRRRERNPLVLIGCAPCQGFSSHRNSAGRSDSRNNLFIDFAKVALRLRPDVIVVENVPELLTPGYWKYVESFRDFLTAAGYHLHIAVHNMAGFSVPQERFRALMLAMRGGFEPVSAFLPRDGFRTVRQAIGGLPTICAGEIHPSDPMHYTARHRESTISTIQAVPKDGGNRPKHVGPECLRRAAERQGRGAYDDVYGRLHWNRPAITLTHYSRNPASGRYVHPEQDRGLSVREVATLQGFPAGYQFAGGFDDRFRQIGNAVPPPFSAYLAAHILGELLSQSHPSAEDVGITAPVASSFSRLIPALKAEYVV